MVAQVVQSQSMAPQKVHDLLQKQMPSLVYFGSTRAFGMAISLSSNVNVTRINAFSPVYKMINLIVNVAATIHNICILKVLFEVQDFKLAITIAYGYNRAAL